MPLSPLAAGWRVTTASTTNQIEKNDFKLRAKIEIFLKLLQDKQIKVIYVLQLAIFKMVNGNGQQKIL